MSALSSHALVLGGACSVWDEVHELEGLAGGSWPGLVIATNDAGASYPGRLHHWVSLHPEKFHPGPEWGDGWVAERGARGHPGGFVTWGGMWRTGRHDGEYVDRVLPCLAVGSSGFHAVMVALHLGCDRVVMAGIPMDASPHFFDPQKPWDSPLAHRQAWQDWEGLLRGRVKSMRGWTQELLGTPSEGWLGLDVAA